MTYRLVLIACLLFAVSVSAEERFCSNGNITIDARYPAGAFEKCRFRDERVELTIKPEDYKVTIEQPWFSFKATAVEPTSLVIRLRFPDAYARYWPKISDDGRTWHRAETSAVRVSNNQKRMDVTVDVDASGVWVSAQELLTQAWYEAWLESIATHPELVVAIVGRSHEDRPIYLVKSKENRQEAIVLIGRQHPAEVPGAIAMREFLDVVLGDTKLASEFRQRFSVLILPLLNPDGVENGHWRHNAGRTDLNRDWGPFSQPETQAVARLLAGLDRIGMQPRLMLDFHATKFTETSMFYTQTDDDVTDPQGFAVNWLGAVRARLADYEFEHAPRPTSAQKNTKGYFFTRYGIPSITYEIGDEADRDELRAVTPVFAEEMMRTMLAN